ncbi:MAG: hypothetical protein L0Y35_07525 [Flammeovirgaceae bacterium]|nr:hypothetical protein [Flammeovirgaceae bacterium]
MDKPEKNEETIDELIKKRKEENEAFKKLLDAIGNKRLKQDKPAKLKKEK